ncbi:MAG: hypothetical protein KGL39_41795 [Patescibacteria group bacterium]|nr:hypothetical protein [Patescibacteria group bacterium]
MDCPCYETKDAKRISAFRNRHFLAQVFLEKGAIRISVNRTDVKKDFNWKEDISWEQLQSIKDSIGYPEKTAIEIYPPKNRVVNIANMRHLWILEDAELPVW